jgi:gluconate 2-dehydrogenase gamma chain
MKMERRTLLSLLAIAPAAAQTATPDPASTSTTEQQAKAPLFFSEQQYQLLRELCQLIIPAEENEVGAIEAGAPEYIDLLTSENRDYQREIQGGLTWMDAYCQDRYGKGFLACDAKERREVLDRMAFRENASQQPELGPGVQFFATVRSLTLDAYFTSKAGVEYLGFRGNSPLPEFTGCPLATK